MSKQERRYGTWVGKPHGHPEDKLRCIEEVYGSGNFISSQCRRKRVDGRILQATLSKEAWDDNWR